MLGNSKQIRLTAPLSGQKRRLLREHHQDMYEHSPPESVHALDDPFHGNNLRFWAVYDEDNLAGCGALLALNKAHGEINAMHTAKPYLRQGVGQSLLLYIIEQAKHKGYQRLSLDTGSMAFFAPARAMYTRHGFVRCAPFGDYSDDPNSVCMTLKLG